MPLVRLVYASVLQPLSAAQVQELLSKSRLANAGKSITGMILLSGRHCLQVLEGPADGTDHLYSRILLDPRHRWVTRMSRDRIVDRDFEQWSMGSASITSADLEELVGIEDFVRDPMALASLNADRAASLLGAFKRQQWRHRLDSQAVLDQHEGRSE
jgi:hypothetical protein